MANNIDSKTVRVLHVLGSMNRGGIETWLLQVLPHIDRSQFHLDFCCLSGEPGLYAPEIEALGSQVYRCRLTKNLVRFNAEFARVLAAGQYDVVHSHVHHFSGYILWQAARAGIKTRIAHSFTDPRTTNLPLARQAYLKIMSCLIKRYATVGLGNSRGSMRSLFGANWQSDKRWQLMYLGIDLGPFERPIDRAEVRKQYGVPIEAFVIGHVGRLTAAKNHRFLVEIAAEIERKCDNIWCIIVGDGPLRAEIEAYAQQKQVSRLIMTGSVEETRSLYGMIDLFVFPSLWEGLPQAVVEAQAAGLRCLCADTITSEVAVVPDAVVFMPLAEGAVRWAQACCDMLNLPRMDQGRAIAAVSAGPFAIDCSVAALSKLYASDSMYLTTETMT